MIEIYSLRYTYRTRFSEGCGRFPVRTTNRSRSLPSSTMMRGIGKSVRPTRILTHIGSVLRQRGGGFSLSFASSPSPPPCPPPSHSPSLRDRTPRESTSATPRPARAFACSPLLRHLCRYTSCSSALFCLLFMSLPVPLPLSSTLPTPRRRRRRLLLRLLLAFPTCGVDLVASPPPRRPGSAVHQ